MATQHRPAMPRAAQSSKEPQDAMRGTKLQGAKRLASTTPSLCSTRRGLTKRLQRCPLGREELP
eukprot:3148700-Amphidinium_carterae.1